MMIFFNRMRGGGVPYGSIYASLFIGLVFWLITLNPYVALLVAVGYNLGERMGWGSPASAVSWAVVSRSGL